MLWLVSKQSGRKETGKRQWEESQSHGKQDPALLTQLSPRVTQKNLRLFVSAEGESYL